MTVNKSQRIILATSALLAVIVLFLHNPTGGYLLEETRMGSRYLEKSLPGCNSVRLEELIQAIQRLSNAEALEKDKLAQLCFPSEAVEYQVTLPFSDWRSKAAVLPWLSSVANALWSLIAILIGAGVSAALLRSPRSE